ncbi:hypothetical protein [Streptosporangium sp. NPDC049376]|uniref:hypothetical protein n=1 Tax=Streptosporangium sp. NPDC049376 TaxID=3366192 RepID=UPI0037899E85
MSSSSPEGDFVIKITGLFASALLAAAVLASPGEASAAVKLDLWTGHNQTGDSTHVEVPGEESCVDVDDGPWPTQSARNHSGTFIAELYLGEGCAGNPVETVATNSKANFRHVHQVGSVKFVEP